MARNKNRPTKKSLPRHSQTTTDEEKAAKAQYEQARRRQWCVIKKTNQLNVLCKKKVFLLIVDDRHADFLSSEDVSEAWPYSWERLVRDNT